MNAGDGSQPPRCQAGDHVTLRQLVHAHIRALLEETHSIKKTAAIVGMHPGALSRKIEKEKITWTKHARRGNANASANAQPNSNVSFPSPASGRDTWGSD